MRNHKSNHRTKHIQRLAKEAIDLVRECNIAKEGQLAFKAAAVFFFVSETGLKSQKVIADWLGFFYTDINTIYGNWRINGLLNDNKPIVEMDDTEDETLSFLLGVTLTSLAGAGELKAIKVGMPKLLPPSGFILPPLLAIQQLLLPAPKD
jgi:hypothetical protein